jgi:hypothetical protein
MDAPNGILITPSVGSNPCPEFDLRTTPTQLRKKLSRWSRGPTRYQLQLGPQAVRVANTLVETEAPQVPSWPHAAPVPSLPRSAQSNELACPPSLPTSNPLPSGPSNARAKAKSEALQESPQVTCMRAHLQARSKRRRARLTNMRQLAQAGPRER